MTQEQTPKCWGEVLTDGKVNSIWFSFPLCQYLPPSLPLVFSCSVLAVDGLVSEATSGELLPLNCIPSWALSH